jgi:hypothetical protein
MIHFDKGNSLREPALTEFIKNGKPDKAIKWWIRLGFILTRSCCRWYNLALAG